MRLILVTLSLFACPAPEAPQPTDTGTDTDTPAAEARSPTPLRDMLLGAGPGVGTTRLDDGAGCVEKDNIPCTFHTGRGGTNCDPATERCQCRRTTECTYVGHKCVPK